MKAKTKEQLDKIEKIVKHDLSNGRMIQKKLQKKLESNGICPKEFKQELEKIKDGE